MATSGAGELEFIDGIMTFRHFEAKTTSFCTKAKVEAQKYVPTRWRSEAHLKSGFAVVQ